MIMNEESPPYGGQGTQGMFWKADKKRDIDRIIENLADHVKSQWNWEIPLVIRIEPYQNPRSLNQNALFHVWVRQMVNHFKPKMPELTEDEMKNVCKLRFLGTEDVKVGKKVLTGQLKETSKLKKGEMYFFMEEVYQWCLGLGLQLDTPADSEFMKIRKSQA